MKSNDLNTALALIRKGQSHITEAVVCLTESETYLDHDYLLVYSERLKAVSMDLSFLQAELKESAS